MYIFTNSFFDPVKIAGSGQAFRFKVIDNEHIELVAHGRYLQIAVLGDDRFALSCTEEDFKDIWEDYFDLNRDYGKVEASVDPDDRYLSAAVRYGHGIRILRQDIWETVISYIISQRRSIPSITTCVERLSSLRGHKLSVPALEPPFVHASSDEYYSFPAVEDMAGITPEELASIGAGYRGAYILSAVDDFRSGKLTPELLRASDDDRLYEILTSMFGVGKKVANCIMLFALARTSRFPIDVWIDRILNKYYGGAFDTSRYPDTAGIMQQYMFYYERNDSLHIT